MGEETLVEQAGISKIIDDERNESLIIDRDRIISKNTVSGLKVDTTKIKDGVKINIVLENDVNIDRPVHLCFGVTNKKATQIIKLNLDTVLFFLFLKM